MKQTSSVQYHGGECSLCLLVSKTGKALAKRLQRNFKAKGVDITLEQWGVLSQLWVKDGQCQQDLSVCTDRDKPCMTRLLDTMEKNNLVVRVPDRDDRRIKLIYLTHKGRELQHRLRPLFHQSTEEALNGIDSGNIAICRDVLQYMLANLLER